MSSSYHHLRPVPWNISDAVLLFAIHFLVLGLVTSVVFAVVRPTTPTTSSNNTTTAVVAVTTDTQSIVGTDSNMDSHTIADSKEEQSHPVKVLWLKTPPQYRQWVFVLILLSAVLLAPLSEELLFRVVIQGALWKLDWWCRYKYRHVFRFFGRCLGQKGNNPNIPCGLATILLTAGMFAIVHLRPERTSPYTFSLAICTTVGFVLAQCISFPLSVIYLRCRGASLQDLGWKFDHIFHDVWVGVSRYLLIIPFVFAVSFLGDLFLLPHQRDVLPVFVFAVMLSWVYLCNRRFIQVVAMHAALNSTSLMILYW